MSPLSAEAILAQTEHRPWELPGGRWLMGQAWNRLLFGHWPVPVDVLRPLIPEQLSIDTFDGQAWLGVVPFDMSDVRLRGRVPVPFMTAFPELNVRTYVTMGAKAGVWFFSLEASSKLAVRGARWLYHLPYMDAAMSSTQVGATVHYSSKRSHRNEPPAEFVGSYRPTSDVFYAEPDSLEWWLTERYCLYAADRRGRIHRGEIHHMQWPLQTAEAEITSNTMAQAQGIDLPDSAPLLHYVERLEVLVWGLRRVEA